MHPLISIITPVYKVEQYLNECVESILAQSVANFELILVDDGSPDHCPAMCDAWAGKDNRVKVIHKPNGGVASARNAGIEAASGDWFWFIDSDDTIEPKALQELTELIRPDLDLIVFNQSKNETYQKGERFFDEYYFRYRFGFEAWNKLYRAAIIRDNDLGFDTRETIGEDLLFNITYYQFAEKYLFSDLALYHYRVREDSAMGAKDPERLQKQLRVYSKIYDCYHDSLDQKTLAQLFVMHLIAGINQSDKADLKTEENYRLVQTAVKQYAFDKKAFSVAVKAFLESEQASAAGKARIKMFFGLLGVNVKAAFAVF